MYVTLYDTRKKLKTRQIYFWIKRGKKMIFWYGKYIAFFILSKQAVK